MTLALDGQCPIAPLVPILGSLGSSEAWTDHLFEQSGAVVVSAMIGIVLLIAGSMLLLFGARLVKPVIFLCVFFWSFAVTFFVIEVLLSAEDATPTTSCYALLIGPVMAGLFLGSVATLLIDTAFIAVGSAVGAALGYVAYAVFFYQFSCGLTWLSHDLVYWICIIGSSCGGAFLLAQLELQLLIVATATLGGMVMVPAIDVLVLRRVDERFLWVLDATAFAKHFWSPFVLSQAIGAIALAFVGARFQMHQARLLFAYDRAGYVPFIPPVVYVRP